MITINVALKENPYPILIGRNILKDLGRHLKKITPSRNALVITDPLVRKYHGTSIVKGLERSGFAVKIFQVPQGEKSKSLEVASDLMEKIVLQDEIRNSIIVALGGGVIGDLGGFIAAVYKRGIPYVQVPTTLLAQIDSAIGGKVGVDLPVGKNLIGAFHQPKMVVSDISVLSTLSPRQIRNGLAEAVKYGVISDSALFDFISKNHKDLLSKDVRTLMVLVKRCSRIKAAVVMKDEKETKSIRTILNFGHTFGHAIEAAGKYRRYQHGEAIALGMRIAAEISRVVSRLSSDDAARLNLVLSDIGLPKEIKGLKKSEIFKMMKHDKKFLTGKNRFVLASRIGKVKVAEGIPANVIDLALERFIK